MKKKKIPFREILSLTVIGLAIHQATVYLKTRKLEKAKRAEIAKSEEISIDAIRAASYVIEHRMLTGYYDNKYTYEVEADFNQEVKFQQIILNQK